MRVLIISLLALTVLLSFAKSPAKSQETLMREYIDEKLKVSESRQWILCTEKTIKDAVEYVDSIIAVQSNFGISDSIQTPGKPVKPAKPYDTLRLDSTPIVPIIDRFSDTLADTIR